MSTVAQVVDRLYERLHSPDEQPVKAPLNGAVLAADTTWTLDLATLTPEEQDLLVVGVIVEAGQDQRYITSANLSTGVIGVSGAVNGTTAASHADGDYVSINPAFSRKRAFDAVCNAVVNLYDDLWYQTTADITSSSTYTEVPATVAVAIGFRWMDGSGRLRSGSASLVKDLPAAISSTGQAVTFSNVPPGTAGHLVYRSKFALPTAETDDLATFGVDPSWEQIVVVDAMADVVYSTDVDKLSVEWLARQLENEQVPVGSATRIRDSLLRYRSYLIENASRRLRAEYPTPTVFDPVVQGF